MCLSATSTSEQALEPGRTAAGVEGGAGAAPKDSDGHPGPEYDAAMAAPQTHIVAPELADRPVVRLTRLFVQFLHVEAASGVVLAACTLLALLAANSPLASWYETLWNQTFRVTLGEFELSYPLWYWINDGLMAIFFFVIGLEIKREMMVGELSEPRKVVLPVAAAVGGVAVPILIFLARQHGEAGQAGWAIPMATDIAFVVGGLALLGSRVPHGLKILVLSLAIVDDILAVLVIALFYTADIKVVWLAAALGGFALTWLLSRLGVRTVPVYVFVGAAIWLCTLKSGVHPTVAGVALGLVTPASTWLGRASFLDILDRTVGLLRRREAPIPEGHEHGALDELVFASREAVSPLERLERALHPWVGFVIMPIFALANAGVGVSLGALLNPVATSVAAGLVVGKPLGIFLASWLVVRLGWALLPGGVSWPVVFGAGCLGGIGFTMSLFIASLSLEGDLLRAAKAGILMGSAVSIVAGMSILALRLRSEEKPAGDG
jgi:Na+:H+ antiporter, NhaA family